MSSEFIPCDATSAIVITGIFLAFVITACGLGVIFLLENISDKLKSIDFKLLSAKRLQGRASENPRQENGKVTHG